MASEGYTCTFEVPLDPTPSALDSEGRCEDQLEPGTCWSTGRKWGMKECLPVGIWTL